MRPVVQASVGDDEDDDCLERFARLRGDNGNDLQPNLHKSLALGAKNSNMPRLLTTNLPLYPSNPVEYKTITRSTIQQFVICETVRTYKDPLPWNP